MIKIVIKYVLPNGLETITYNFMDKKIYIGYNKIL